MKIVSKELDAKFVPKPILLKSIITIINESGGGQAAFEFSTKTNRSSEALTFDTVSEKVTVMAVSTQFSIAVHMMAGLGFLPETETTSTQLASSVNTSPSFVRRILSKLSKAGLVCTRMGKTGSTSLARDPKDDLLADVDKEIVMSDILAWLDARIPKEDAAAA